MIRPNISEMLEKGFELLETPEEAARIVLVEPQLVLPRTALRVLWMS